MNSTIRIILILFCLGISVPELPAQQTGYTDYNSMSGKISALGKEYPSLVSARSLVKTAGGKDIMLLTIGTGEMNSKPGIAILGGIEGNHIFGRELALGIATAFLRESGSREIKKLLEKVTFYILPDVSPDATEQFFSGLKYERRINARPTDDDRDFQTDEDPCEDLDRDGYITFIRVEDPAGRFVKSDEDERVMAEADVAKGQTGNYLYFTEGYDNDGDDEYNEDGQGGVNFNRNFTYNYEEFGPGAGLHPVSEPESKAVADFLYERFNIYAVFSFGPQDNLAQPMKSADQTRAERRITSIMKSDEAVNRIVSEIYHDITGIKGNPEAKNDPGNFMEWAYYHYGRYSFSTPAWWFPAEKGKNPEAEFLKSAGERIDEVFVPWKDIEHPGFPGRKAEAGGIRPFAMTNPPADSIAPIVERNYRFIARVAAMHPELEFAEIKTEKAGDDVFRITLRIVNKGVFATVAEAGELNTWTRIMRVSLEPVKGQELLSGRKVQRISRLAGGQSAEFSWLISGSGPVQVTAGAANTGIIKTTVNLK